MEAPKLPSFFRNVRRKPRRFQFRSSYYDAKEAELQHRKAKIEQELSSEDERSPESPPSIRFSRSNRRAGSYKMASRAAAYRLVIILIILLFLAYRGLVWLEIWE